MKTPRKILPVTMFLVAALGLLPGCGGESEKDLIASAKTYLEKNDSGAAIIQIKTVLQRNGQNAEARYLLGKALLERGDVVAAGVELRKARDLHFSDDLVLPALARTMLRQGESRKVTDQFGDLSLNQAEANADLKTTVALAYIAQKEKDKAQEALTAAQQAVPLYAPALIISARLKAGDGDIDGALFLLEEVIGKDAKNEAALIFKGELLAFGRKNETAAVEAWRAVIAENPKAVAPQVAIISLLLRNKDVDGAKAQFEQLKKAMPNHVETKFFEAQFAYLRQDYKGVRELTDQILKVAPDHPKTLQLAGAAEYQMKSLLQAENFLARALKGDPTLLLSRQLLAQVYIRSAQPNKAIELLQPLIEAADPDPRMLALAGEAYMQAGDMRRSEEVFSRAARTNTKDPRVRTTLALNQLSKGNDQGFAELESVAAADSGPRADLALVAARLRRNDLDGALKAIDALQKKQPDNPLTYALRGRIQALRKDDKAAAASFEKAMSLDPLYFPAVAMLAALDLRAGKPDQARQRFEAMLKVDPKNYKAMLALADLKARAGGSKDEVARLIADAVKLNPAEPAPRVLLINQHLATGDTKAALTAAQDATAVLPNNLDVMEALGRAQLAAGDAQQAISTFKKLAALQPTRAQPQVRLADAYLAAKDRESAEQALKRALDIQPDLLPAQRGLVALALAEHRALDAMTVARTVQKQRPNEGVGFLIEGEVEASRKSWDAAIAAFRTSLQKAKTVEAAVNLHNALLQSGKRAEAERFAAAWVAERPQDAGFAFYLGDTALAQSDWVQAEARYRSVVKIQPDNALALNNIAWLLVKQSKPGAVDFAAKANQLLPEKVPLMDTLAMALLVENQASRALEVQKQAVERAPNDPALRLNLARIYVKTGDKVQARAELEKLAKLGDKFPSQAEVAELLKSV